MEPFECFSVIIESQPEETRLVVEQSYRDMIVELSSHYAIDISDLVGLCIVDNYAGFVLNFAREGMKKDSITNNEYAQGVAKTIPKIVQGRVALTIVVDINFLISCQDANNMGLFLSILHHELCHVEDICYKCAVFDYYLKEHDRSRCTFLFGLADMIWSEYYACRQSLNGVVDIKFMYLSPLVKVVNNFEDDIRKAQLECEKNSGEAALFGRYCSIIKLMLYYIGCASGCASGYEKKIDQFLEKNVGLVKDEGVLGLCIDIQVCLDEMYDARSEWGEYDAFSPLESVVQQFFTFRGLCI